MKSQLACEKNEGSGFAIDEALVVPLIKWFHSIKLIFLFYLLIDVQIKKEYIFLCD